ncbi:uncharacterized protein [Choristoneura fumiferana]|uniref:uncharacterized protein n=1 Tax=Choristoneura fumiferana TaxID=7141 RepID=UPI003D1594BA
MTNCKPVPTPIVKNMQKVTTSENKEKFPYREAVGALSYLMVGTRPDIAYAVGVVSRTLQNPTDGDIIRVKRILRYIQGTKEYGITYKGNNKPITMYTDADLGGDPTTGRSTSGMVCLFSSGAISWRSLRQRTVALSSSEAEIVAASEATRELLWLKHIIEDVAMNVQTVELLIDSESALKLSKNPIERHHQTKHMHVQRRHFFLRECLMQDTNNLIAKKVSSEQNVADMMTKPLYKPRLLVLMEPLGM